MFLMTMIILTTSTTLASIGIRPAGWLDRLVGYHRNKFLQDFNELAPIKIKATVIPKPEGYVDSPNWDFDAVIRLLALIRESEDAEPAKEAVQRALRPGRRFMSADTYKYFSSLAKKTPEDIYYSVEEADYNQDYYLDKPRVFDEDAVITITNPVEARLPSGKISVGLLKQILEQRAAAARVMPTTKQQTPSTIKLQSRPTSVTKSSVSTSNTSEPSGTDRGIDTTAATETTISDTPTSEHTPEESERNQPEE